MAELMHRNLSAKLRALPSHRTQSFRKSRDLTDWNDENLQQDQLGSTSPEGWVVRTVPERWRAAAKFDTTSPYSQQRVTVDLGVTTSYRKEGPTKFIIGAEIFDLMWASNMFSNADDCRGWFIDELEVNFEPLWRQEEIVTGALYPKTSNTSTYFGNSSQVGITGFIGRNPTVAVSMSNTRSQQTSQPMYTCRWEQGSSGVMSLHWKLNLWCPTSCSNNNNLELHPKVYNPRRWSGSKVPRLPPDYEKGNFNGLDFKPRVEWVVPAAVVRAGRAAWRVTVNANLSCVSSKKTWFFATDRYFAQREMHHEEIWRFPGKITSGQFAESEWLSPASSRCSGHHSCRSSLLL